MYADVFILSQVCHLHPLRIPLQVHQHLFFAPLQSLLSPSPSSFSFSFLMNLFIYPGRTDCALLISNALLYLSHSYTLWHTVSSKGTALLRDTLEIFFYFDFLCLYFPRMTGFSESSPLSFFVCLFVFTFRLVARYHQGPGVCRFFFQPNKTQNTHFHWLALVELQRRN